MRFAEYESLVIKHNGWLEQSGRDDWVARFGTVHDMRQFQREFDKRMADNA